MITVEVLNPHVINLVNKDLRKVGRDLASKGRLRQPFHKIRDEVLIPSIEHNFKVGGRVGGQRWEPISPETFARRKTSSGSAVEGTLTAKPLIDTGRMKFAATRKARFSIRDNTMTYGDWPNNRWFGPIHDIKELADNANIPQRQFVLIQPEDANAIQEIMIEWVEATVRKNMRLHYA